MAWYWVLILGAMLGVAARNRLEAFSPRRLVNRWRRTAGRKVVLTGALVAASLALISCGPNFPQGPAGEVVNRESKLSCKTIGAGAARSQSCKWKYWLTTQDTQGTDHRFSVTASDYRNCDKHAVAVYPAYLTHASAGTTGSR
ncbi:hypothetical protein ACGFNY_44695 [Streptomyces chartreusis]|uniref:hypothetical protein n=1 Tax=Streptomyces chartreusis TaxID=1969 RepID=UPI0037138662